MKKKIKRFTRAQIINEIIALDREWYENTKNEVLSKYYVTYKREYDVRITDNLDKKVGNDKPENVTNILKVLSIKEKKRLLEWAEKCQKIQKSKYSVKRKFTEIAKVTAESKSLQDVFNLMWKNIQNIWTDRRFVTKFAVMGGVLGIVFGGLGGAGIVALGSAVGIRFFLVTASGGAFIGMLIQELKKEKESEEI